MVFSHHNGTCGSDGGDVRLLQHMATGEHGERFAYEIGHALAVPGQGYRAPSGFVVQAMRNASLWDMYVFVAQQDCA